MSDDAQTQVETLELIKQSLHIDSIDALTHEEMIRLIAQRVDYLLENDKDLLLSYLYRLDISMKKINNVLRMKNVIPPHQSLALLIYQRQLERVNTKKKIKVDPIEGWEF
jgi:hypothetical protein